MNEIKWLKGLKSKILSFLAHQKSKNKDGYFRYSFSGDLFSEKDNWGLGASIFAAKIYYILNEINTIDKNFRNNWIDFIKSFGNSKTGEFYDKLVLKKTKLKRKILSFKNLDFSDFFGNIYKRAETRRVWEGLFFLGSKPDYPYKKIPKNEVEIENYFKKLNWEKPWGAASHVGHLLFFLYNNQKLFNHNNQKLINFVLDYLSNYQSKKDGSWYKGENVPGYEKINSAMKICMGLHTIKVYEFPYPEKLVDLCLKEKFKMDACNIVNRIYILHSCSLITDYKKKEIKQFAKRAINLCRKFFHENEGGFSFYLHRANDKYYGATISKGLNEPDIHGTSMFLWGLAIISKILGFDKELGFELPTVHY